MTRLTLSATSLSAWLVGMVGFACAALLLPLPAWPRTEQGKQTSNGGRPDQLSYVISQFSDSSVFDFLLQSNRQQSATYRPQQAAKIKRPQQVAKIKRPQQAAKIRRPQQAAKIIPPS